jgi:hypothetical protein
MHQSLVNNLSHWFFNKICQRLFWFAKIRWFVKDNLDQEALEGIVWFFQVA